MIINLVFLDFLAGNVFNLEIQYGSAWAVLHQITVEVVSVGEVLLAELSEHALGDDRTASILCPLSAL